jgi:hypothetical protein
MIHMQSLVDEAKCFATVRDMRWPDDVQCPNAIVQRLPDRGMMTRNLSGNAMAVSPVSGALTI